MSDKGQTILITVEEGFSSRYLLRTDIFKILKSSGARIIILSLNSDENYFKAEFGGNNVFFEGYEVEKCSRYLESSVLQKLLRTVRAYTTNSNYHINAIKFWYTFYRKNRPNNIIVKKIHNWLVDLLVFLLGRSKILRRFEIFFESMLFTRNFYSNLFLRYKPDLLLTTSL